MALPFIAARTGGWGVQIRKIHEKIFLAPKLMILHKVAYALGYATWTPK